MLKYLFVAEKSSLCKSIQAGIAKCGPYPYAADFFALHGHFLELVDPDEYQDDWGKPWSTSVLPMIPSTFKYKVKNDCRNDFLRLKKMMNGGYDYIVNACDPEREGEAIFWTLYNNTGCKTPALRLWEDDQLPEALGKACHNLRDYSTDNYLQGLRDSAFCRQEFDWLVGMNFSRAAMLRTKKRTSAGRVKSPTTNIVVERDLLIDNFKPDDFFEIEGTFNNPTNGNKYTGSWFKDKVTSFENEAEAKATIVKLQNEGVIKSVVCKQEKTYAPSCYSLTDIQRDANKIYGFTASETLDLVQKLYEEYKIVSYPRTESRALSTSLAKEFPKRLDALSDIPELKPYVDKILANKSLIDSVAKNKKYVNDAELAAHHAIVNTNIKPDLSKLSDKETKIYMLIVKRFLSIFMDPLVQSKTTAITIVGTETFKSTGTITDDKGFKVLYRTNETAKDVLPPLKVGEKYHAAFKLLSKKTQPPAPMTEATLLEAMINAGKFVTEEEERNLLNDVSGIGTTATRAHIIEDLVSKGLLVRQGKTIRSTPFGKETIAAFKGRDFISPALTAQWEKKLRNIENKEITAAEFRKDMCRYISEGTKDLLDNLKVINLDDRKEVAACPLCGKPIVEGKNYFLCSRYKKETEPSCTFILKKELCGAKITSTTIKSLVSGKETKPMNFKGSKGPFTAKLKYNKTDKKIEFVFCNKIDTKPVGKAKK